MVVRVLLPEYSLVKVVLVVVEVVCLLYIIISLLYLNSIELNCSNLCRLFRFRLLFILPLYSTSLLATAKG